ncbi:MAG: electron transport complex subunit RsxB [Proteobacteria bacterium]|nr:MAG: electron transport complex subunit RsxB [Pseudomonadota bacterium]
MLEAIIALSALAAVFGLLLGYADLRFKVESDPVVDQIDALLPQTQCGQCGFPGCRPYAEAIAGEEAAINLCPPGGDAAMIGLADLLGREPVALDEATANRVPSVARIDEALCVGCTACIRACPVDAILGAAKQMHTVLPDYCTGCKLCVEPCPVDCISMEPVNPGIGEWKWPMPAQLESAG